MRDDLWQYLEHFPRFSRDFSMKERTMPRKNVSVSTSFIDPPCQIAFLGGSPISRQDMPTSQNQNVTMVGFLSQHLLCEYKLFLSRLQMNGIPLYVENVRSYSTQILFPFLSALFNFSTLNHRRFPGIRETNEKEAQKRVLQH